MNLWKRYDRYLERTAKSGTRVSGIGRVHLILVPFFAAIVLVVSVFDAFGLHGPVATPFEGVVCVALLVGLFYSGFRFIYWSSRRASDEG